LEGNEGKFVKGRSTEVWCKIALLFVFGAAYVLAIPFPEDAKQFPQLLAAISFVLTAAGLAADFGRRDRVAAEIGDVDDTELKPVDAATRQARSKRFWQAWAIILASTGVGIAGGFLYSAACLFAGFAFVFGARQKLAANLAVAVAMTALVYLVFGRLMGVPLLEGVL
jgi:Tripartite tricarboxylate transporter TctB family